MKIQMIRDDNRLSVFRKFVMALCWFVMLSFTLVCTTACNQETSAPVYDEEVEPVDEVELFAVVGELDEVNEKIMLRSIGYEKEYELSFTGGTDVKNKYGDVMPMAGVELGSIVEAVYDANRDKLLSLQISDEEGVSKVEAVSGAEIDYIKNTIRINGTTYVLSDGVTAYSDNIRIGLDEICSEDQLTLWMYNDKIYSIYVELGHGYVRLLDYASYLGGMVEIGYDVIVPVTENMLLTVREGKYTLRIAKGEDVGTKTVEVIKNQEIDVSLADIAIEPKQMGSVLFEVTPANAAVYVDGKRINTEGAVDIVYGKHKLVIAAEGYETYNATFQVKHAYKVRKFTLTKAGEEDTETSGTTAAGTTGNGTTAAGSSAGTENSTTTENSTATGTNSAENGTDSGSASTESGTDLGNASAENGTESGDTSQETNQTETSNGKTEDSGVKDVTNATGTKTSNKVIVSAPLGASVYFDGEYLGIAPISFTKVTGSHIITFSQTGYLSKSYTVNFTDDGIDTTLSYEDLILISSLISSR